MSAPWRIWKMADVIVLGQIILLFILVRGTISEYSYEMCKSRGFNKAALYCSTCKLLVEPQFQCKKPYDDCMQCCNDDDDVLERYPKAVLQICKCKYGAYPQIEAFINSNRPKKYKKHLELKFPQGLDPFITLHDSDGTLRKHFDIRAWTTDQVEEFFDTHLKMTNIGGSGNTDARDEL